MPKHMQPLVAIRALKALIANPEDTQKVFEVIRAMAGDVHDRNFQRFMQTKEGPTILARERSLLDTLLDKQQLSLMAPGSLGRAYLDFMYRESITADGLVEASESHEAAEYEDPNAEVFGLRLRDQHDLWHIVSGYGTDIAGEDCLLAFSYAQTRNRGLGIICLVGALKLSRHIGVSIFKSVWNAYRDGKRAAWLPEQDWESLLNMPLVQVRKQLNVPKPIAYMNIPVGIAPAT